MAHKEMDISVTEAMFQTERSMEAIRELDDDRLTKANAMLEAGVCVGVWFVCAAFWLHGVSTCCHAVDNLMYETAHNQSFCEH